MEPYLGYYYNPLNWIYIWFKSVKKLCFVITALRRRNTETTVTLFPCFIDVRVIPYMMNEDAENIFYRIINMAFEFRFKLYQHL